MKNPIGQRGQSLVQILISVGIMSSMAMIFATMMTNQQRETASLTQKLASLDQEKLLIATLANGAVCQYALNNPVKTFDATKLPYTITLDATTPLYASISGGVPVGTPPGIAAQANTIASPISQSLITSSIQLVVLSGGSGQYTANWVINFDPTKLVRPINPNVIGTALTVDDSNPAAAKIISCQNSGAASSSKDAAFIVTSQTFVVPAGVTPSNQFKFTIVGGGAGGPNNGGGSGAGGNVIYYTKGLSTGQSIPIVIGGGGASIGALGYPGSATTVTVNGVILNAGGGTPGTNTAGMFYGAGGKGGTATGGKINIAGQDGQAASDFASGNGGNSLLGFGGQGSGNSGYGAKPSTGYGSGGGGGYNKLGSPGKPGAVLIEWN